MYQETVTMIDNLVPVTIAAVDGVCTGGGLELTLVCDFVVATNRSRWGMPEINWDITPGWGGTAKIAKFAGRRKAKEWNLIGALFSAAVAERHDLDQPSLRARSARSTKSTHSSRSCSPKTLPRCRLRSTSSTRAPTSTWRTA